MPRGTTVKLNEYALALGGSPHGLDATGMLRLVPPETIGPPRGPLKFRVSLTRHGTTG